MVSRLVSAAARRQSHKLVLVADVSCTTTLTAAGVRERVLDGDALPQTLATGRRRGELAEAFLQRLVLGNGNGAPVSGGRVRALRAGGTTVTMLGIELHGAAELERLGVPFGACDRAITDVNVEAGLREPLAVSCRPGAANDLATAAFDTPDDRRVDVRAIDIERVDPLTNP